jgi:hypothetical protein
MRCAPQPLGAGPCCGPTLLSVYTQVKASSTPHRTEHFEEVGERGRQPRRATKDVGRQFVVRTDRVAINAVPGTMVLTAPATAAPKTPKGMRVVQPRMLSPRDRRGRARA